MHKGGAAGGAHGSLRAQSGSGGGLLPSRSATGAALQRLVAAYAVYALVAARRLPPCAAQPLLQGRRGATLLHVLG